MGCVAAGMRAGGRLPGTPSIHERQHGGAAYIRRNAGMRHGLLYNVQERNDQFVQAQQVVLVLPFERLHAAQQPLTCSQPRVVIPVTTDISDQLHQRRMICAGGCAIGLDDADDLGAVKAQHAVFVGSDEQRLACLLDLLIFSGGDRYLLLIAKKCFVNSKVSHSLPAFRHTMRDT